MGPTAAMDLITLVVLAVAIGVAAIPATIARKKGRSFAGFFVFGLFFLVPALIVALLIKPAGPSTRGGGDWQPRISGH